VDILEEGDYLKGGGKMANPNKNGARCDFRIAPQAKALIEQAAAANGQSLTEFAVSTLVEKARQVLKEENVRVFSERDARKFLRLLEEQEPNAALRAAARKYKKERHDAVAD
jgi:uncharacterized protein (DUF1778 family)